LRYLRFTDIPQYLGDLAGYPSAIGGRKSNVSKPEISQDPGGSVDAKLIRQTKFPPEFNKKVDMTKVNVEVMKK
jgi:hypothetical protein